VAYRIAAISMIFSDLQSRTLIESFSNGIFRKLVQQHALSRSFNRHSASRGPSTIAETLVILDYDAATSSN